MALRLGSLQLSCSKAQQQTSSNILGWSGTLPTSAGITRDLPEARWLSQLQRWVHSQAHVNQTFSSYFKRELATILSATPPRPTRLCLHFIKHPRYCTSSRSARILLLNHGQIPTPCE